MTHVLSSSLYLTLIVNGSGNYIDNFYSDNFCQCRVAKTFRKLIYFMYLFENGLNHALITHLDDLIVAFQSKVRSISLQCICSEKYRISD